MSYVELLKEQNEGVSERFELAGNRVRDMLDENSVKLPYSDYFKSCARFIICVLDLMPSIESAEILSKSQEELEQINYKLYEDIMEENYETSYANPAYATKMLTSKYGRLLSFLYTEIRGIIVYAYEHRMCDLTYVLELFIEVYNYFEEEDEYTAKDVKRAIYYYASDYLDVTMEYRTRELLDPNLSFARDIIMESDLEDTRYLYRYGEYISENEIRTAQFLNSLEQDEINHMAQTYTSGYIRGFEIAGIDLSKKHTVAIRYRIGFERMVRAAILQFREVGLECTLYRAAVNSVCKRQHLKIGYHSTSPNRQYDYDHRFDNGLYFDKAFTERKLSCQRQAYEIYKVEAAQFAGPAVIEVFGEKRFEPMNKAESIQLDLKQQKLFTVYNKEATLLSNEYMNNEEISFTIIAYPIPEIGAQFEEIFADTVKVNTLDNQTYIQVQQALIDTLDQGDTVHILGAGNNRTDLIVNLYELNNPQKETIFENCTADVNIPVGEVFTSPKLKGTNGILHVTKVYLNELEYIDLELRFEEGMIVEYTCKNFENEEENKKYIKENLLYNNETLPMGEFAIGTNTTAYVMARRYGIEDKFPILIAEKTGPHFAIGDTCYKMSEDHAVFNPDGKEIVARDNEVSILRKTQIDKAYFSCHTDITIPYNELKKISVVTKNIREIDLISQGKFVLEGTQLLNEAFEE